MFSQQEGVECCSLSLLGAEGKSFSQEIKLVQSAGIWGADITQPKNTQGKLKSLSRCSQLQPKDCENHPK